MLTNLHRRNDNPAASSFMTFYIIIYLLLFIEAINDTRMSQDFVVKILLKRFCTWNCEYDASQKRIRPFYFNDDVILNRGNNLTALFSRLT